MGTTCSLLSSRSGLFIFQLARLFLQDTTGHQDITGQFQDFRGLFFTRGYFDTWTRPEHLLSLLPDCVLPFLACFPLQNHQVSGGCRDRSPVVISSLTTTRIYSTFFLHQPGHLALTSTPPRAYCLLASLDFALTTTTRWVFLFCSWIASNRISRSGRERETTEHLDGATDLR